MMGVFRTQKLLMEQGLMEVHGINMSSQKIDEKQKKTERSMNEYGLDRSELALLSVGDSPWHNEWIRSNSGQHTCRI